MANDVPIVIGKRVSFGMIVGGAVTIAAWISNEVYGFEVPAEVAVALTTFFTGIGQVFIANKYGITTHADLDQ